MQNPSPNNHSQCDIYSGARFVPEKAWHKTTTYINAPVVGVRAMGVVILENFRPEISEAIYSVMQESYKQEASSLGLEHFPPLDKTACEIANDTGAYYGVFINESLAGVLHFNSGNIDTLVVRPCFQRLGVAGNLLSHLFKEAKGAEITVSTARLNMAATSLYQKVGFSLVKTHQRSGIQLVTYAKRL